MLSRVVVLTAVLSAPTLASACTCFFVHNDSVSLFARNYDWGLERGVLMVNKRGVAKTAFSFEKPAEWTSSYGSVTFNQYGREFPNDGMNEAGLVVAVMWLAETRYPAADDRPSVTSAQWVQHQLDTAATVAEVIASDRRVRVMPTAGAPVHYLVADASGAAAVIEWVGGERRVYTGDSLPVPVLTNDTYPRSVDYLRKHEGFGGDRPVSVSRMSLDRFVRAARATAAACSSDDCSTDQVFRGLAGVAQGERTKWSIVYDNRHRTVRFKTLSSPALKRVSLAALDLTTNSPTKVLGVATADAGDIAPRFVDYDTQQNLREINAAFDATFFLSAWPKAMRERLARYPEAMCRPVAASVAK
ncbi:MAG: linear amide C-N hydrolase [Planctomycetota bacterium]